MSQTDSGASGNGCRPARPHTRNGSSFTGGSRCRSHVCLSLWSALPLGVSTTRGSKSMGLVLSLILMLVYYLVFIGGTRVAANAQFSPLAGAWLANLGFAVLAFSCSYDPTANTKTAPCMAAFGCNQTGFQASWQPFGLTRSAFQPLGLLADAPSEVFPRARYLRPARLLVFLCAGPRGVRFAVHHRDAVRAAAGHRQEQRQYRHRGRATSSFFCRRSSIGCFLLTVLLAILINLGTLTKTNEILAVKAGAISLYRMAMPLLLMGLMLSDRHLLCCRISCCLTPISGRTNTGTSSKAGRRRHIGIRTESGWRDPATASITTTTSIRISNLFGGISIFSFQAEHVGAERMGFCGTRGMGQDQSGTSRMAGYGSSTADAMRRTTKPSNSLSLPGVDTPEYFKKEVRTAAQMTYGELKEYVEDLRQSGFDVSSSDGGSEPEAVVSARVLHHGHHRNSLFIHDGKEGRILRNRIVRRRGDLLLVHV